MNATMPLRFTLYLRVSTARQGRSGLGLDAQQASAESYVSRVGGEIVAIYTEVESGKRSDRAALAEAQGYCRKHKTDLLVTNMDRAGRNAFDLLGMLEDARRHGYRLICTDYPEADTTMLQMYAIFADLEGRRISERTKRALAAKKAQGFKLGTPEPSRGGTVTASVMRAKADNFALNTAPLIESLAAQGMSEYQIAKELIRRGVKSARGGDSWNGTAVRSVRERAARLAAA
jgi:DNA invertase Pin-like site-specific DNA recombinase